MNLAASTLHERKTAFTGAPQRRRSPVGEGPAQGGCRLNVIAGARAGKPARAEPRDKAHVWWVSNLQAVNACEA
jgi:hypothetical protein